MARIWVSTSWETPVLAVGATASFSFEQEEIANTDAAHRTAAESTFLILMGFWGLVVEKLVKGWTQVEHNNCNHQYRFD
jgi:hypothetical protein